MKTLQILVRAIALTLAVAAAPAVFAHGDDKPKYGGVVAEVKDVNYELVAKADTVAISSVRLKVEQNQLVSGGG